MGQIIDLSHFSIWLLILSICKGFALFTIIHTLYKDKFNSFITLITTLISISAWNTVNQYSKLLAEKADNSAFVILSYVSLILFIFAVFAISIDTKTKNKITGSLLIFGLYIFIWIGSSAILSFIWSKVGYQDLIDNLPTYKSTIALTLSNALTYLFGGYIVSLFLRLSKIKASDFKAKYLYFSITATDKIIKIDTKNPFINRKKVIQEGHGNGTKIIKEIAEKHGGDYKASSENGIYTTHTTLRNVKANI